MLSTLVLPRTSGTTVVKRPSLDARLVIPAVCLGFWLVSLLAAAHLPELDAAVLTIAGP